MCSRLPGAQEQVVCAGAPCDPPHVRREGVTPLALEVDKAEGVHRVGPSAVDMYSFYRRSEASFDRILQTRRASAEEAYTDPSAPVQSHAHPRPVALTPAQRPRRSRKKITCKDSLYRPIDGLTVVNAKGVYNAMDRAFKRYFLGFI